MASAGPAQGASQHYPGSHLGVFAPNSPYRQEITLCPEIRKGFQFKLMWWAKLLNFS